MSAGRAERRRAERAHAKADRQPVVVIGDNVLAAGLGTQYEARQGAKLKPKVPGEHRWIVTAAWVASDALIAAAHDPDVPKLLDAENMIEFAIGCADCERALVDGAEHTSCDAPPSQWWR